MIHFITFGQGHNFIAAAKRLLTQAYDIHTFDSLQMFTDEDLKTDPVYWKKHGEFTNANKRGYGYFLWKPYLIMKVMETMCDGDIIVYADAGCEIDPENEERIAQLHHLCEVVKHDKVIGSECNRERNMNKMDLMVYMDALDEKYLSSSQRQATAVMIYKEASTMEFVRKWYEIGCMYNYIDDSPSVYRNYPCYDEHRHDQSIFSLLTKKMNMYCTTERIESAIYILRNREGRHRKCMGVVGTQFWCHPKGHFDLNQVDLISRIVRKQKPKYVLETGFSTGRATASVLCSCDSVQIYVNCDKNYHDMIPEGPIMKEMFHNFYPCFHSYEVESQTLLTETFLKNQFPFGIDFVVLDGENHDQIVLHDLQHIGPILNKDGCIVINTNNNVNIRNMCVNYVHEHESEYTWNQWEKDKKGMIIIVKIS